MLYSYKNNKKSIEMQYNQVNLSKIILDGNN